MFRLGVVVVGAGVIVVMVVVGVGQKIWDKATSRAPTAGTYTVDRPFGMTVSDQPVRVDTIVVRDQLMTVNFVISRGGKIGNGDVTLTCPDLGPQDGFGQSMMIRVEKHGVFDFPGGEAYRPVDYECNGRDKITYPAGRPVRFWSSFKLLADFSHPFAIAYDTSKILSSAGLADVELASLPLARG